MEKFKRENYLRKIRGFYDDDDIIKVHVHTEKPGVALQHGLEYGQLLTVKVENMKEQHRRVEEASDKAKKKDNHFWLLWFW